MDSNPSVDELQLTQEQEREAQKLLGERFISLTETEQSAVSAVLFPESTVIDIDFGYRDAEEITPEGTMKVKKPVRRRLHPIPSKISRAINSVLRPFITRNSEAISSKTVVSLDEDIIASLYEVAKILTKYYGWTDVEDQVQNEEIPVPHLQALATVQQQLNGVNDFLLASLRVLVQNMRIAEIANIKFNSMFSTPVFRKSGDAA
jgi:hypothetical protein